LHEGNDKNFLSVACFDKIINQTKLPTAVINSALILMEMKGKVKNLGGHNYISGL